MRRRVEATGRTRRFGRGEFLFHHGDPASALFLITQGLVAVRLTTEDGNVVTVDIATPGEVLGELALLRPGGRRSATALALEPVVALAVDRSVFDELRREVPRVTELLLDLLADRIRYLDERLVEALYVPADVRVLRRLWELTRHYGDTVPFRQEDLAGLAGTTRASVNRVLRRMEVAGSVRLGRARVTVLDRASLQKAAGLPPELGAPQPLPSVG